MHDKEWKILESIISLAFDPSNPLIVELPGISKNFPQKRVFFSIELDFKQYFLLTSQQLLIQTSSTTIKKKFAEKFKKKDFFDRRWKTGRRQRKMSFTEFVVFYVRQKKNTKNRNFLLIYLIFFSSFAQFLWHL